jgi:hypothetical protein
MKHGATTEAGTKREGAERFSKASPPKYIRLPRAGTRCAVTGLTRTALNELILPTAANGYRAIVRSYSLKRPGQIRGIRLISLPDLVRHIEASGE